MLEVALVALVAILPAQVPSQVRIETTRVQHGFAANASSDGKWVVGVHLRSHFPWLFPFRWSSATGFESLLESDPVHEGLAISDDGRHVLTRYMFDTYHDLSTAAVSTPGGVLVFPGKGQLSGTSIGMGCNITRDGRFVAGWAQSDLSWWPQSDKGWVWEIGGDVRILESTWGDGTRAFDVSDDGRVAVGLAFHDRWPLVAHYPALWTHGAFEVLGDTWGAAYGTTFDGSFVAGEVGMLPFLWSRERGVRVLETLPPIVWTGWFHGFRGIRVSDDGTTVLIRQFQVAAMQPEIELNSHLWREGAGAVDTGELLAAFGAEIPDDLLDLELLSLGADGRTLVGGASTSLRPDHPRLLWRAVLPPAAEPYCTAQASANGCRPSLGFDGTPSARTGAGFEISAGDVPAGAFGVLAYGTSGAANVPFGGGVLCVAEPTTRVALGQAGGSQGCEGALAIDFNAVVAAANDPALLGGAYVWAQMWIRDSAAPPQVLLSDALAFTLWP